MSDYLEKNISVVDKRLYGHLFKWKINLNLAKNADM